MELVRIGDKIVNRQRLYRLVDKILTLRSSGATQQDVANTLDLERPFISNLERLGEVRIGGKAALVGFSISNKQDVKRVAKEHGIDSVYLYNNGEMLSNFLKRVERVDERGVLTEILKTLANLRNFDLLIFLGSASEGALLEKVLGLHVFSIPVEDHDENERRVEPREIAEFLEHLVIDERGKKAERGKQAERGRKRKFRIFKKGS